MKDLTIMGHMIWTLLLGWMLGAAGAAPRLERDELAGISYRVPFDRPIVKNQRQVYGLLQAQMNDPTLKGFAPTSALYDRDSDRYLLIWYSSESHGSTLIKQLSGDTVHPLSNETKGLLVFQVGADQTRWAMVQKLNAGMALILWHGRSHDEVYLKKLASSLTPLPGREPQVTVDPVNQTDLRRLAVALTSGSVLVLTWLLLLIRKRRLSQSGHGSVPQIQLENPAVRR
jgi:hypothetical protein